MLMMVNLPWMSDAPDVFVCVCVCTLTHMYFCSCMYVDAYMCAVCVHIGVCVSYQNVALPVNKSSIS